jgi:DNA-binding NtrC family response regulator
MKPVLLIADGDRELCHVYQKFLVRQDYQVETASDGLDCLVKLRRLKPAVLVLDLDLRWGGSERVLAWLREEDPMPKVPVVLMTTADPPEPGAELVEPPVVQCLGKPFSLTALFASVRSAAAIGEQPSRNGSRDPAPLGLSF